MLLIDINSFMSVTGPKTDLWLVKAVGASLSRSACSHVSTALAQRPAIVLGPGICISFIIDSYYALKNVISDIYLVDAFVELIFFAGWMYILVVDSTARVEKK